MEYDGTELLDWCTLSAILFHARNDVLAVVQVIMDTCQDAQQLASLRNLALGAEALNPATLANAQRMAPNAVAYNCYGEHPYPRAPMHKAICASPAPACSHIVAGPSTCHTFE